MSDKTEETEIRVGRDTLKVIQVARAGEGEVVDLEDQIARDLVELTRVLVTSKRAKHVAGALGGRFGYGCDFENDAFSMHAYCWCGREAGPAACPVCVDQATEGDDGVERKTPHFAVKGTPIEVRWYKWIGRSMEVGPSTLTHEAWAEAFARCLASVTS